MFRDFHFSPHEFSLCIVSGLSLVLFVFQTWVNAVFEDPFEPFAKFDYFFNMALHFVTVVEIECEFRGFF